MVWPYHDVHILIERDQKMQKAFNGELPELAVQSVRPRAVVA